MCWGIIIKCWVSVLLSWSQGLGVLSNEDWWRPLKTQQDLQRRPIYSNINKCHCAVFTVSACVRSVCARHYIFRCWGKFDLSHPAEMWHVQSVRIRPIQLAGPGKYALRLVKSQLKTKMHYKTSLGGFGRGQCPHLSVRTPRGRTMCLWSGLTCLLVLRGNRKLRWRIDRWFFP